MPSLISNLLKSAPVGSNFGDLNAFQLQAEKQFQSDKSFENLLMISAVHLLQGALDNAKEAISLAATNYGNDSLAESIVERFRWIIFLESYDLMPNETFVISVEVDVMKRKIDGWPKWDLHPMDLTGNDSIKGIIKFLNIRLKNWNWRHLKELIRGIQFVPDSSGIVDGFQSQLNSCRAALSKGELYAGSAAADFCRTAGALEEADKWILETNELAQNSGDLLLQANLRLRAADWWVAPSSAPVIWNFTLVSGTTHTASLSPVIESKEFLLPSQEYINRAKTAWEKARHRYNEVGSQRGEGQILLRYGYLSMLEGDFSRTKALAREAITIFIKNGDRLSARLAETHLMLALIGNNQILEAQKLAASIGEWGKKTTNFSWTIGLGLLTGRYARHLALRKRMSEKAINAYQIARIIYRSIGANFYAAQTLFDIGEVYKAIGDAQSAIINLDQSADGFEAVLNKEWKGIEYLKNFVINTRANLLLLISGNYQLGIQDKDANLMDRSLDRMNSFYALLMAEITPEELQQMPHVSGTINAYRQWSEEGSVLSPLYHAETKRLSGDNNGFQQDWDLAFQNLGKVSTTLRASLGISVWSVSGNWEKAADCANQSIEGLKGNNGFLDEIMDFMALMGQQGKEQNEQQAELQQIQILQILVRSRQYSKAFDQYNWLNENYGNNWWIGQNTPWLTLSEFGEMMEGLGKYNEALMFSDAALDLLEKRRSQLTKDALKMAIAAFQNTHYIFAYAARTAMSAGQIQRAFAYFEKGKARGLLDLINENKYYFENNQAAHNSILNLREIDARYTILVSQLALLQSNEIPSKPEEKILQEEIAKITQERLIAERVKAKSNSISNDKFKNSSSFLDSTQVSSYLALNTLLIEYLMLGDDLIIWAINKNEIVATKAFKIEDWKIISKINQLRKAISQRSVWKEFAVELSEYLIEPIQDAIREYEKLIIVPHGALHVLPFQVLMLDGKSLGLTHSISYLPSASALQFLEEVKNLDTAKVLAIGNPTGDLSAAALEANLVASLFDQEKEVLIGAAATEIAIRERIPEAELLHFATHGNISEYTPLLSALALANNEELTLQEIMGLQLKAKLVVLSACETGQGKRTNGDDVLGLTRGLIASGANSAVVSYWPVNDVSTSLLMGHFYQQLKNGIDPATALHLSQLYLFDINEKDKLKHLDSLQEVINNETARGILDAARSQRASGAYDIQQDEIVGYDHPYYWAAFAFVGR